MICIQRPTSPLGPGPALRSTQHPHPTSPAVALASTGAVAIGHPASSQQTLQELQAQLPLQMSSPLPQPASSSPSSKLLSSRSSMAATASASALETLPPGTTASVRASRAERSLLNVLERERRGRANSASSSSRPAVPTTPSPPAPPSPPQGPLSPAASRAPSRAPSRGPSRSASPVPRTCDAFGFGFSETQLDLASLVERSIALQSSSPANTPPSSPPRPARRPHFSTSPSLAAASTIPESTESDTDNASSSTTTTIHRKRAATITSLHTQPGPGAASGPQRAYVDRAGTQGPSSSSALARPAIGPRARSNPTSTVAAPVPRRAAASAAAAFLLPNPHAGGVTHLPPAARDQGTAYTPSNTVALRDPQRPAPVPPVFGGPERPLSPPYSYPGAPGPNIPAHMHHLRPAISISSVASAASAQSAASGHSASVLSGVSNVAPITPCRTPPQMSPLNPRPPSRRAHPKRTPRPISGPFLAPAADPAESDIPFDVDRAARRLRNAPGRVCFDDVALFPPSDDADDEEEDPARKRPRMGRRWSLW